MECTKCGKDNAPLRKYCIFCGAILTGRTFNNVTGKMGVRNLDGSFTPDSVENNISKWNYFLE